MRKIDAQQISVFAVLVTVVVGLVFLMAGLFHRALPRSEYRPLVISLALVVSAFAAAVLVYRIFLKLLPLQEGDLAPGSRGELSAQVNILFYLIFFNSLIRSNLLPVPLMRGVYMALGAQLGANTYSAGALLDPPLTTLGDNCIVGHNAVIFAHAIEGARMSLSRVEIGDNVTIGAMAVVMAGVTIESDAIVSAGAVVLKGTRIRRGEIWGGVPAKCIAHREDLA